MTVVNYGQYNEEKKAFFKKHHHNFTCNTSDINIYGRYEKTYVFEDNAQWHEVMSPEYVSQEVEIKMCKVQVEVKMLRTEFWSSDDTYSKYYYEKF